jgi:hypothetical protein
MKNTTHKSNGATLGHRAAIDSFVAIQTFSVTFHIIAFVDYISSFARVKDLKHYCMYI